MSDTVLFLSDIHFHNFRAHSRVLEDGTNSRLANAVQVIDFLREYCVRHDIRHVLCGGDVFHERGRLDVEVFNQPLGAFRRLSRVADVIVVVGNHDQSPTNDREHALEAFKPFVRVVDTPQEIRIGGHLLAAFPFQRNAEEQKRLFAEYNRASVDIVSTHIGVAGVPGRTFFIAEPVQRQHLAARAGLVLLGHYHDFAQVSENGYYAGSAQAIEWGDANRVKYALRVELGETPQVTPLPLPGLWFIECASLDELERRTHEVAGNIVRVHAPMEDAKAVQERLARLDAHDAQVVPVGREVREMEEPPGQVTTLRQAVLERASRVGPGLSAARAAELGLEILSACGEDEVHA